MISFDAALAKVVQAAGLLGTERVALSDAHGRVLAETVRAKTPLPPHDYSAMDGYAVNTADFGGPLPVTLPVRGESRTGRVAPRFERGSACRIYTGAPIPDGADAIVMQEDTTRTGDVLAVQTTPTAGEHVRRRGEDLPENAVALETGTRLGAIQLGLLAAVDRASVDVARRPRVTVMATGDELRPPGSEPRPASIPESNGVAIAALAREAGADVVVSAPAKDDPEETRARIRAALDASDVLVTIGGVSVGDHDVVRPALEAAGVTLEFHKVAIKPGKPLTLGRRGETHVLGLPGNPVSAQVTFLLFGLPLLRALQGARDVLPIARRVRLSAPIRQKTGRRGFYAATLAGDVATPLRGQSSGATTILAWADALVVVPEDSEGLAAGDVADAHLLRGS
ncbi:MAG TPA: gephyrin-like molybdotransferase Glp [Polyangiaceae bacterium]|nr:gephyrin-like molybdotransferase Glp [Polyangiaceae bacterium]